MIGKVTVRVVCYPLGSCERLKEPSAPGYADGYARCNSCGVSGLYWHTKAGKPVRGWRHKKGCPTAVLAKKRG